jgi:chemotaxis signal transduction protein
MKKVETSSLLKQTNVLGNYLDEMLHDATRLSSNDVNQSIRQQGAKLESLERALLAEVEIENLMPEIPQVTVLDEAKEFEVSNTIAINERSSANVESKAKMDLKGVSYQNKQSHKLDISQFPIQCLMFRVGHNLLSLPLIEMSGVVRWTDKLTQLPQSPDWVLGVLQHLDTNLRVLDSSKVLGIPVLTQQKPGHILLLSDNVSAISCDILEDVVTLEYNDIQWQSETGNVRMYGVIRGTLAYLLNPSGIIDSLNLTGEL